MATFMGNRLIHVFFLTTFMVTAAGQALAQNSVVPGKVSLQDRYPKKSGNLLFSEMSISYPRMLDNQVQTQSLKFYNSAKYPIQVSAASAAPHLTVEVTPVVKPGAEGTLSVTFDAKRKADYGFVMDQLTLSTTDSSQAMKSISIATIIEPFFPPMTAEDSAMAPALFVKDSIFNYQAKQGEVVRRDLQLSNTGKRELKILAVKTTCGCIGATMDVTSIEPGKSAVIHASLNSAGKSGRDTHEIVLYTNDPKRTKIEIPVSGLTLP